MMTALQTAKDAQSPSPFGGRILIACYDRSTAERLQAIFNVADLTSDCAKDFKGACNLLKSGDFQLVSATSKMADSAWRILMDISPANCPMPYFVVIACSFDLGDWADCLKYGAFDVLDSIGELARAAEVALNAFSLAFVNVVPRSEEMNLLERHDISGFRDNCPEICRLTELN